MLELHELFIPESARFLCFYCIILQYCINCWSYTGWSKSLYAPDDYSTYKRWVADGHQRTHSECGPCCTEQGLREQFGVSINVWRLAEDTLNITCNFLRCNHQVHRDFLITLYNSLFLLLPFINDVSHAASTDTYLRILLMIEQEHCVGVPCFSSTVLIQYLRVFVVSHVYLLYLMCICCTMSVLLFLL